MRISSAYIAQMFVASQNNQEATLAQTQQQIATGLQFSAPAQNPSAATQVLGLQATLSQLGQYGTDANLAQSRLSIEDTTLSSVVNTLQSIRTLALEAANATANDSTRASLAQQIQGEAQSLLQLANTQDGNGQYLFSGTATTTTPFSQSAGGVSYAGTQNQRLVQIGAGVEIADGDSGAAVFQQIPNGNGTFVVNAAVGNKGSALVGANSVTSLATWNAGKPPYTISFSSGSAYTVKDSSGAQVATGNYTDGGTISFNGAQLSLSGTPAAGDSFTVAKSSNQDIFATIQGLVSALKPNASSSQTATVELINRAIEALDQGQNNISLVQAQVGARLQTIDAQNSTNSNLTLQLQSSMSGLRDLDYAAATSALNQQITALQAAQASFARIQGLSLFNYIQ
jgi:flagellar hook-associated protein 3 FlgL